MFVSILCALGRVPVGTLLGRKSLNLSGRRFSWTPFRVVYLLRTVAAISVRHFIMTCSWADIPWETFIVFLFSGGHSVVEFSHRGMCYLPLGSFSNIDTPRIGKRKVLVVASLPLTVGSSTIC